MQEFFSEKLGTPKSEYTEKHCWQYDIRLKNADKDILISRLPKEELENLTVKDFVFEPLHESVFSYVDVCEFIRRHEWLGKMSLQPTHIFVTSYKHVLAGVVVMDMPACFSKILGDRTKLLERLISRGACVSWSPKCLASSLIMQSIKWMVQNTPYRVFTAYSDPEARELGTIYQACNFHYLGQSFGTKRQYSFDGKKWFSDRSFRSRSAYKRYAKELRIPWGKNWQVREKIWWESIPDDIELLLRDTAKKKQIECMVKESPQKHKYAYILGENKRETKILLKEFHKTTKTYTYPKER